jgi:hypothetical protein
MKRLVWLAALLGLAGCFNGQPKMSQHTPTGQPCHKIGYSFAPVWVSPDGKSVCW